MLYSFGLNKKKFKFLKSFKKSTGGRNNLGSISVRHRGHIVKHSYLFVDFFRNTISEKAAMLFLTKDVHRTALLGLIKYASGFYSYIIAPEGLVIGRYVQTLFRPARFSRGCYLGYQVLVGYLPIDSKIYNVELLPLRGGHFARSAGTFCKISYIDDERRLAWVLLPTRKRLMISFYCSVSVGRVSNYKNYKKIIGKAGVNRKFGVRPSVRGVAMNPVDHPHGGRTKSNSPEVTPWNKIAKLRH